MKTSIKFLLTVSPKLSVERNQKHLCRKFLLFGAMEIPNSTNIGSCLDQTEIDSFWVYFQHYFDRNASFSTQECQNTSLPELLLAVIVSFKTKSKTTTTKSVETAFR